MNRLTGQSSLTPADCESAINRLPGQSSLSAGVASAGAAVSAGRFSRYS